MRRRFADMEQLPARPGGSGRADRAAAHVSRRARRRHHPHRCSRWAAPPRCWPAASTAGTGCSRRASSAPASMPGGVTCGLRRRLPCAGRIDELEFEGENACGCADGAPRRTARSTRSRSADAALGELGIAQHRVPARHRRRRSLIFPSAADLRLRVRGLRWRRRDDRQLRLRGRRACGTGSRSASSERPVPAGDVRRAVQWPPPELAQRPARDQAMPACMAMRAATFLVRDPRADQALAPPRLFHIACWTGAAASALLEQFMPRFLPNAHGHRQSTGTRRRSSGAARP